MDQLLIDCLEKDPAARPRGGEAIAERLAAVPFLLSHGVGSGGAVVDYVPANADIGTPWLGGR